MVEAQPEMMKTGIYLHIPFCRARCSYCDFNTYIGLDGIFSSYVHALQQEIIRCADLDQCVPTQCPTTPTTIFLGGGTPSLLPPEQIDALIRTCRDAFAMPDGLGEVEITVECNPGTINETYLRALRACGVNRLSFGAQSAAPDELRLLGREHDWSAVVMAIEAARAAGFDNVNLDLIFGLPHQALSSWKNTVTQALSLAPDHISLYALTIEVGTPMYDWTRRGEVPFPDPDLAADMYDYAERALDDAGFVHYEISNWCRPGCACEHNLIYWRNEPYYGFGAGAHRSTITRRSWNVKRPTEYIARIARGESAEMSHEDIDAATSRGETMMLGLRLLQEGVSQVRFAARYGAPISHFYARELQIGVAQGLLEVDDERVRLTSRGRFVSNRVMQLFI